MNNKDEMAISLKDFIKGTISNISSAIRELNTENDLVVNPYDRIFPNDKYPENTIAGNCAYISYVEFNIAVTSVKSNKTEGGVAIKVLNGNIGKNQSNESSSTVKFTLPVVFPYGRVKPIDHPKGSNP